MLFIPFVKHVTTSRFVFDFIHLPKKCTYRCYLINLFSVIILNWQYLEEEKLQDTSSMLLWYHPSFHTLFNLFCRFKPCVNNHIVGLFEATTELLLYFHFTQIPYALTLIVCWASRHYIINKTWNSNPLISKMACQFIANPIYLTGNNTAVCWTQVYQP